MTRRVLLRGLGLIDPEDEADVKRVPLDLRETRPRDRGVYRQKRNSRVTQSPGFLITIAGNPAFSGFARAFMALLTITIHMYSSPDDEFFARSQSRVEVLRRLEQDPRTRNELKKLTDISRFTLSRALSDFGDREWIERVGKRYETTGKGPVVASEFERSWRISRWQKPWTGPWTGSRSKSSTSTSHGWTTPG